MKKNSETISTDPFNVITVASAPMLDVEISRDKYGGIWWNGGRLVTRGLERGAPNFDAERYEAEPLCEKSEINQQPTSLCKSAGMKA